MPWAGPPMHAPAPPAGPALFLYPTNDSFVPKMISLTPSGNRVKIGRQTNTKTVPGERNGYFDSKVLSRQHAEVWEEAGKIFIKDVKSSNGTFVNGERLSVEGMESEPWELKSDDRVEFGIDIVGEDNKTIIHHKVAATVFCVITPDDYAQLSMHHPALQQQHHTQHQNGAYHMQGQQQRRPSLQQAQSPIGLGGLSGGPGLGLSGRSGKSGLTFDHILNRLQNELQKSRETGSELNSLATVMTDISDNLVGGALPASIQSHHSLPPVRPPPPQSEELHPSGDANVNLTSLQNQLLQTQSALATHADKVKTLESVITEHEHVKHELQAMRELMEQRKVEIEAIISHSRLHADDQKHEIDGDHEVDDDGRSTLTIMPEESESVNVPNGSDAFGQEERDRYDDEEARAQSEAMGRPRTPEPHGMGMGEDDDDENDAQHMRRQFDTSSLREPTSNYADHGYPLSPSTSTKHSSDDAGRLTTEELHSQNALLASRLETLAQQLDSALSLSRQLHSQSEAAQQSIELLEAKVKSLEAFVENTKVQQTQHQAEHEAAQTKQREGVTKQQTVMTDLWESWRQRVEGQWRVEREEWDTERLRLQQAVREWESRVGDIEERDQRRSMENGEFIATMQREREEATLAWKRREESLHRLDDTSSDDENDQKPRMVNGTATKNGKGRRLPSVSPSTKLPKLKKRRSSAHAVATPPNSPPLNGEPITERSSEASGSRSASPELSTRGPMMEVFANGHIKPELLPLSPAPSVRHSGPRSGSTNSEPDSTDDISVAPTVGHLAPPSPNPNPTKIGSRRLRENPMPYISVSVVFIGLAAWAFASRAKD